MVTPFPENGPFGSGMAETFGDHKVLSGARILTVSRNARAALLASRRSAVPCPLPVSAGNEVKAPSLSGATGHRQSWRRQAVIRSPSSGLRPGHFKVPRAAEGAEGLVGPNALLRGIKPQ